MSNYLNHVSTAKHVDRHGICCVPKTDVEKIYQSKGNSDTMAVVIPKELRKSLKLKRGDTLEAKVDDKHGLLIYTKM